MRGAPCWPDAGSAFEAIASVEMPRRSAAICRLTSASAWLNASTAPPGIDTERRPFLGHPNVVGSPRRLSTRRGDPPVRFHDVLVPAHRSQISRLKGKPRPLLRLGATRTAILGRTGGRMRGSPQAPVGFLCPAVRPSGRIPGNSISCAPRQTAMRRSRGSWESRSQPSPTASSPWEVATGVVLARTAEST